MFVFLVGLFRLEYSVHIVYLGFCVCLVFFFFLMLYTPYIQLYSVTVVDLLAGAGVFINDM